MYLTVRCAQIIRLQMCVACYQTVKSQHMHLTKLKEHISNLSMESS